MPRSLVIVFASIAVLLTGCEAAPVYSPPPEPTIEPFFPEEEDALEAVDAFMNNYLVAKGAYLRSLGTDPALANFVTSDGLGQEEKAVRDLKVRGMTFVGDYHYFNLEIQQWNQDSADVAFVQAYVCLDYRSSHLASTDGTELPGTRETQPFEAIMYADGARRLELEELRPWTGRDFCQPKP